MFVLQLSGIQIPLSLIYFFSRFYKLVTAFLILNIFGFILVVVLLTFTGGFYSLLNLSIRLIKERNFYLYLSKKNSNPTSKVIEGHIKSLFCLKILFLIDIFFV